MEVGPEVQTSILAEQCMKTGVYKKMLRLFGFGEIYYCDSHMHLKNKMAEEP